MMDDMHRLGEHVWSLGRRPELDGIRGIAIALVVVSHLSSEGSPWRKPGLVGVVVFFTLSGFLITSLLLHEVDRTGRLNLRSFYRARALRLAPALLTCVAVVGLLGLVLGRTFAPPALLLGAVTWSSNWIIATGDYTGSALTHTWSLAIEEQFYLLWPLVLVVLARRRRVLVVVTVFGILLSVTLRIALVGYSATRVMNGSDTRADSILVGCLLAMLMHGRRERGSEPGLALVGMGFVLVSCSLNVPGLVLLGPLTVAIATAGVIAWSAQGGGVRWLAWRPLAVLGQRSYGLYLWHWPLILVVERILHLSGGLQVGLVAIPVAAIVTEFSWRYVEQPFLLRRHNLRTVQVADAEGALSVG